MRGLSLVDILIISVVLALLLLAGSMDFARYSNRFVPPAAAPTAHPAN